MNTLKLGGRMKVEDEYIQELKFLHQIKRYKNVDFHKFRLKEKGIWHTYWYLDKIDIGRLTYPSKLDKRLYGLK